MGLWLKSSVFHPGNSMERFRHFMKIPEKSRKFSLGQSGYISSQAFRFALEP
jgi:hypothetical protein